MSQALQYLSRDLRHVDRCLKHENCSAIQTALIHSALCPLHLLILIFTVSAKDNLNESLTTTKENQYIFVGSEDTNGTEKIVESILDRYENVLFMITTSCKGPRCDGQKIDKQKYFSFETCLYNL